jgi:excisionase family DNA binding protein
MENEHYYTPSEVARQFRVTRQAVYNWIGEGKLSAVKLGQAIRIPSSALRSFVQPVRPGEVIEEDAEDTGEQSANKYSPTLIAA